MPITEQAAKQDWNKIITMAHNNGFPEQTFHKLRNKLIIKRDRPLQTQPIPQHNKRWITFTYHSPTNLFKRTNLQIAFRPTNTIYQHLSQKPNNVKLSRVYQLKCNMCKNAYVGQLGRPITTQYKEHLHYIKNNNPISAYSMHILNSRDEFGPTEETFRLLKPCTKGTRMNCWEAMFIYTHHKHNILISKQQVTDTNPLFDLAYIPCDLEHIPWLLSFLYREPHTCTTG